MSKGYWARKLSNSEVLEIRGAYPSISMAELAKKYGVSRTTIANVVYRIHYTHLPGGLDFPEPKPIKTEIPPFQRLGAAYYLDGDNVNISVDNLLITIDFINKKLTGITFNNYQFGTRLEPEDAIKMLQDHGLLPK